VAVALVTDAAPEKNKDTVFSSENEKISEKPKTAKRR
jgi:hypothetical protein